MNANKGRTNSYLDLWDGNNACSHNDHQHNKTQHIYYYYKSFSEAAPVGFNNGARESISCFCLVVGFKLFFSVSYHFHWQLKISF